MEAKDFANRLCQLRHASQLLNFLKAYFRFRIFNIQIAPVKAQKKL